MLLNTWHMSSQKIYYEEFSVANSLIDYNYYVSSEYDYYYWPQLL